MPSYKYGARTFHVTAVAAASNANSYAIGAWQYLPSVGDAGTSDKHLETVIASALWLDASVATAASTAAAGAAQVAVVQYNSAGSSVNSAVLIDQVVASQAAKIPIDTTSLTKWTLNAGDTLELQALKNTAAVGALPALVWSASVGG